MPRGTTRPAPSAPGVGSGWNCRPPRWCRCPGQGGWPAPSWDPAGCGPQRNSCARARRQAPPQGTLCGSRSLLALSDAAHGLSGVVEQHLHHGEVLVIIFARIGVHAVRRDGHAGDARLHDGPSAVHARHDLHVECAALGSGAGTRRVADGVAFGVLDPQVLGGTRQAFGNVVPYAPGERIVSRGTDLVGRTHDHAAELGVGVLGAGGYYPANVQVVGIPIGNFAHGYAFDYMRTVAGARGIDMIQARGDNPYRHHIVVVSRGLPWQPSPPLTRRSG